MSADDVRAAFRRGAAPRRSIAFGSAIRSYVLAPYQQVKDLRTGVTSNDAVAVLDGDLDAFLDAALVRKATTPPDDDSLCKMD